VRHVALITLLVATLSWGVSVWLYVSAVRGEPEWSRAWAGRPVAVSLFAACVACVVVNLQEERHRRGFHLMAAVMAVGVFCAVLQALADWESTFNGGAIGGDSGDRYLHSHGTRIREIAEEEYLRRDAAGWRLSSAIAAVFGWMGLGAALSACLTTWATASGKPPAGDRSSPPPHLR
jgi:hypothetical protein